MANATSLAMIEGTFKARHHDPSIRAWCKQAIKLERKRRSKDRIK